jgi:hypothetical protein
MLTLVACRGPAATVSSQDPPLTAAPASEMFRIVEGFRTRYRLPALAAAVVRADSTALDLEQALKNRETLKFT